MATSSLNRRELSIRLHPQMEAALNPEASTDRLLDVYARWVSVSQQGTGAATEQDWTDYLRAAERLEADAARLDALVTKPIDMQRLRRHIRHVAVMHEYPSGPVWVYTYCGKGFYKIYKTSNPNVVAQLTDQLEAELDEALVAKAIGEAVLVRRRVKNCREDDRRNPHYSRRTDDDLKAIVTRALDEGWADGGLCYAAMGAIEIIRRRLRAVGVTDFAEALRERIARIEARKRAKSELPAARARLAVYRQNEATYRANGHDIDELIRQEETRVRECEAAL